MTIFEQINEVLGQQLDQPEFWSEYGRQMSTELAQQMTDSDWERLRDHWTSASPEWQYRAANFAAYCDPTRAISVLLEMLRVSCDDVYVRVLESLGEFPVEEVVRRLVVSDVTLIRGMSASLTGVGKLAAESVMRHFGI